MKKHILFSVLSILIAITISWFSFGNSSDKVRYVSMSKLYLESPLYKKFQKDLKQLEKQSNEQLATLQLQIRNLKADGANEQFIKELEGELIEKQQYLTEDYQKKYKRFDKIIWDNINASILKYGKKNDVDFILGAQGNGNIMYASDKKDITQDVIDFMKSK
jgi:outer membrane protein